MIAAGIKACKYFSDKGIKTNVTLGFSVGQALLAAKAGVTYVYPFFMALSISLTKFIKCNSNAITPKRWF